MPLRLAVLLHNYWTSVSYKTHRIAVISSDQKAHCDCLRGLRSHPEITFIELGLEVKVLELVDPDARHWSARRVLHLRTYRSIFCGVAFLRSEQRLKVIE